VFEIVRPGMEDSESAEKQENTGIGPASACRGESAAGRRRAICMVSFAARDVRPHPEERGCRDVSQTRTRVRASRRMRTAAGWPSCFETHHSAFGVRKRLRSRRAAMLLSMRASGAPTCGCAKWPSARFPLFPIDTINGNCNSNVFGLRGPDHPHMSPTMWHHPSVSPPVVIMWHRPSSSHVSPSVVIMCFGCEAPMPPRRIHIRPSNPPPGPRPR